MSHAWREDEALRIILHAAAERIEPAGDGLELIRSRLTMPRPAALAWVGVAWTRLSLRWEPVRELAAATAQVTRQLAARLLLLVAGLAPACGRWLAALIGRLTPWLRRLAVGLDRVAARLGWHGPPLSEQLLRPAVHARRLGRWLASQYRLLDTRLGRFRWLRPVGAMTTAVVLIGAVVYMAAGVSQVISPAGTVVGSGAISGQGQNGTGTGPQGTVGTPIGEFVPGVTKSRRPGLFNHLPCSTISPTRTRVPAPSASSSPASSPTPSSSSSSSPSPSLSPTPTPTPTPTSPSPSPSVTPSNAPASQAPAAVYSSLVPHAAGPQFTKLLSVRGAPAVVTPGPMAVTCASPTPTRSSSAASPAVQTSPSATGAMTLMLSAGTSRRVQE